MRRDFSRVSTQTSSHEELLSSSRSEGRKKVLPHFSRTTENATEEGDATLRTRPYRASQNQLHRDEVPRRDLRCVNVFATWMPAAFSIVWENCWRTFFLPSSRPEDKSPLSNDASSSIPYGGPKLARMAHGELLCLSSMPGHISARPDLQILPGNRRYSKIPWLEPMVNALPMASTNLLHEWKLTTATILLEELELMLGLPKDKKGEEYRIAHIVAPINSWAILGEITTKHEDLRCSISTVLTQVSGTLWAGWLAQNAGLFSIFKRDGGVRRLLIATPGDVAFWLPLFWLIVYMHAACCTRDRRADFDRRIATGSRVTTWSRRSDMSRSVTPSMVTSLVGSPRFQGEPGTWVCSGFVPVQWHGPAGCDLQVWWFGWSPQFLFGLVERQLDLSSMAARLRGSVMADQRDWGGGGDDPEDPTQRMIEWIWESLTEIRMRMDQPGPAQPAIPVVEEVVPVAPALPPVGVEVVYGALALIALLGSAVHMVVLRLQWLPLQLGAPGSEVWWFGWSPQFLFGLVERQLDLSSVAARLRVTSEAHPPYSFQVRESRRLPIRLLVPGRTVAEQGLCHLQQCNFLSLYTSGYASASARSREAESCQAHYQMGMHINFKVTDDPSVKCMSMLHHPLSFVGAPLHMTIQAWCAMAMIKGLKEWRIYFKTMIEELFEMRLRFLHNKMIRVPQRIGLALRLIGDEALVLYNPDRCYLQCGAARTVVPTLSHYPPIQARKMNDEQDEQEDDVTHEYQLPLQRVRSIVSGA
ncbi:hypothetical protein Taro_039741 [Colocasia esculenta]|uniref:Uncharacterized protein n=1 Tax=Colocasia esculenta TaxID=4460 RepID=A0A843WWK1_COLES|nr:hypothetical protein [Colocasia esculenta]